MNEKMGIKALPEEILKHIFHYCEPENLLQVEETCKEWRSVCIKFDEDMWNNHIEALWAHFVFNKPNDLSLLHRISKLSTAKMVKMLRHIDLSRCVEKKDYQRMLLAKLVFERQMEKELAGNDPRFKGRYLSMYYPDWSLTIPPYKASYFHTRRDISRNVIFTSELCAIRWQFQFKHAIEVAGMTFTSIFHEDGTMESEVQQQQYQWRFIKYNGNEIRIQVDQYPPLSMKRLENGAWQLENQHVIMNQRDSLDGDNIPLL